MERDNRSDRDSRIGPDSRIGNEEIGRPQDEEIVGAGDESLAEVDDLDDDLNEEDNREDEV